MRLRYKSNGEETFGYRFNMCALSEILTGDDTVSTKDLDVFLTAKQEWKDLHQAFKDKDVITDNYNTMIHEPRNNDERERGYSL